jgi:hypothetical protein
MYRIVAATEPLDLCHSAGKIAFSREIKSALAYRNESANRNPDDLGGRFA